MRKFLTILVVLLALISLVSLYMAFAEIKARKNDIKQFDELSEMVSATVNASAAVESEKVIFESSDDTEEVPAEKAAPSRDISLLLEQNDDCIGWIYVSDTDINYPVMHTPYYPQKYIRRDFYGKYSVSGVPFVDGECKLDSDNLIIYGHNMTNGTMFADLEDYYAEEFFLSHPTIEFQTKQGVFLYNVYAVLKVKNDDDWYYFVDSEDGEEFETVVSALKDRAIFTTDYLPKHGDKFITLSTCYGRYGDNRTILVGVLVGSALS